MRSPKTVKALEELGRVRLSDSFFMRDFLHSEISQIEGIPNIPDFPDVAIEAGKNLCQKVLEPIQSQFGRVSIRSAYRSPAVNAKGAENGNQYNCARNEANYAGHIWDYRDEDGFMGATACIVVNRFIPYFEETGHWQALAWWIHDHIPEYSSMNFFPTLAAFNLSWHEQPKKVIKSHIPGSKGILTKPGMDNFSGDHSSEYLRLIKFVR
ncbi:peptidase M15 [Alkalimonas sp. MEB108]|uniref:Peptidase M15 n=1 Tax=Alkalimonas cellulosilytica TaxID=3058395 RepID=A0ABU7JAL8_9GAMM|nr:peptidase M15 [Alkalimonas sp. MEB108]MEE2003318.1 peptidase M15 [Alkalimonas sp. MEB108]